MRLPILLGLVLSFLAPALAAQRGFRNEHRPEGQAPRHVQRELPAPRTVRERFEERRPGARATHGRHEQVRQRIVERLRGRLEEMRREHRREHLRHRAIERVRANRDQQPRAGARGAAPELRQRIENRIRERVQSERRAPEAPLRRPLARPEAAKPEAAKPKPEVGAGKGQKKRRVVAE